MNPEKKIYEDLMPEQRRKQISIVSNHVEDRTIRHHYSEDKLTELKDQFSGVAIEINSIEEEFEVVKAGFKQRLDPLKMESKDMLKSIIRKYDDVMQKVFAIPNFDDSLMEFYDEEGTMVDSRRMLPSEKQMRII